ncbi:hypothetical protein [Colwellia sp. C1TZA3]|uniref:hypothetical protein n=1 Tax=Colwellia sp. C1TZA3 TaxID=2508879 RepID=UPI0011BA015F|nr:hypothetical protein [Colwellia sp. C1TZA3]TWX63017.1 hypothetical protein ESZ39_17420 [Colwellia sp. C1TZA3]
MPEWRYDISTYQGPYSESGEYYQEQNIIAPAALRNTVPIGKGDWLIARLYTRTEKPIVLDYIDVIPIPLSYCSLVLVKIAQGCVALTPNSQLLLNRAPYLELFFLRTTRSQT